MQGELAESKGIERKIYSVMKKENILGNDWKFKNVFNFFQNSSLLK